MASIGSLVVCVDDKESPHDYIYTFPNGRVVYDEIYVISGEIRHSVGPDAWIIEDKPAIFIEEGRDSGWRKSRFKEVQPPMNIEKLLEESIKELV